jgi:hypothetical protein
MFLCYKEPANMSYFGWENEALPLGNGKIGAKVFGGKECELIHFNEKTLWSGGADVNGYTGGVKSTDKGEGLRKIQTLLDKNDVNQVLKGLKSAAGYLRRELGHALNLRYTPELIFERDDSIDKGAHVLDLLRNPEAVKPPNPANAHIILDEE